MPKVVTNNTDLRLALTQQPGEEAARVTVKRNGQSVSYSELERMTSADLVSCEISSFDKSVIVTRNPTSYAIMGEDYIVCGGPGGAQTYFGRGQKASDALESFYQLGIAVLTGGGL